MTAYPAGLVTSASEEKYRTEAGKLKYYHSQPVDEGFEEELDEFDCTVDTPTGLEGLLQQLSVERPRHIITEWNENTLSKGTYDSSPPTLAQILRSSYQFEATSEHNLVLDRNTQASKPLVIFATRMKLIEVLTTALDYKFMDDFLMTVEMIMETGEFAQVILSRLAQAFGAVDSDAEQYKSPSLGRDVIKMRCMIVLQHWAQVNLAATGDGIILDGTVVKFVVESLDMILTSGRYVTESDRRFLIKVRRIYDPNCLIGPASLDRCPESPVFTISETDDQPIEAFHAMSAYSSSLTDRRKKVTFRARFKKALCRLFSRDEATHRLQLDPASPTGSASSPEFGYRGQRQLVRRRSSSSSPANISSAGSLASDMESMQLTPVLLTERSRTLARILMVLEADMMHDISRAELVAFPRARESIDSLYAHCPQLQRHIEHFNSMCRWFARQIAEASQSPSTTCPQQVELLAKMIRLGVKCVLQHNYSTAMQIILSLQAPAVASNQALWQALPPWERQLARDLLSFGSPSRNFKHVRKTLEEILGDRGAVVPFVGLFLSDLVMNYERPESCDLEVSRDSPMIPFYKNHLAAKIVRLFCAFQRPQYRVTTFLTGHERQMYSYFADVGRLDGEFM